MDSRKYMNGLFTLENGDQEHKEPRIQANRHDCGFVLGHYESFSLSVSLSRPLTPTHLDGLLAKQICKHLPNWYDFLIVSAFHGSR